MVPAPIIIDFDSVHVADTACSTAATPPAACMVPTPGTMVPIDAIAPGISIPAPIPAM